MSVSEVWNADAVAGACSRCDYFQHWVDVGAKADQDKLPKIFYVNWFRKDDNNDKLPGGFMWPGYGDNSRVLAWIFDRCDEKDNYVDTPIGYMNQLSLMIVSLRQRTFLL